MCLSELVGGSEREESPLCWKIFANVRLVICERVLSVTNRNQNKTSSKVCFFFSPGSFRGIVETYFGGSCPIWPLES